jgi:hypothetical protein
MNRLSGLARLAIPIVLLAASASPALADTGGGSGDLGLDAIAITSASVNGRTGIATVSGTISCSQDVSDVFVGAQLDQVVGRFHTVRGWGGTTVSCSAVEGIAAWTAIVRADQGKFAGGNATAYAEGYVELCIDVDCSVDYASVGPQAIRLGR